LQNKLRNTSIQIFKAITLFKWFWDMNISLLRNRIYYSCLLIFEQKFESCFEINKIWYISWLQNFYASFEIIFAKSSKKWTHERNIRNSVDEYALKKSIYNILWDIQLEVQLIYLSFNISNENDSIFINGVRHQL
jgi:hypothetical protein